MLNGVDRLGSQRELTFTLELSAERCVRQSRVSQVLNHNSSYAVEANRAVVHIYKCTLAMLVEPLAGDKLDLQIRGTP